MIKDIIKTPKGNTMYNDEVKITIESNLKEERRAYTMRISLKELSNVSSDYDDFRATMRDIEKIIKTRIINFILEDLMTFLFLKEREGMNDVLNKENGQDV